jgi:hypothetical protein
VVVKAGDTIPVKDLEVRVVAASGQSIGAALPGAGKPNPSCASFRRAEEEKGENPQSVALLIQYGNFRVADLGDLTWNKEFDLVCPTDKLGPVDLFIVSHHARLTSNSPQLMQALAPKAAIIPNGAKKGGDPEGLRIIKASPGLQEVWQLHYSVAGGTELNTADAYIANLNEICEGKWIKVTAMKDGSFTVENSRNRHQKTYVK